MESIEKLLTEYSKSDYYGFHMPGHKRNILKWGEQIPYQLDITEIDGFDDLHHCEGIIKEAQERAAKVFGAEETCFLINGSTVGNISAIMGVTSPGDKIIIARNNHKSVYNATIINHLDPVYLYPKVDDTCNIITEISVKEIEETLKNHSDAKVVVIVSPTYEGVLSNIKDIADMVHKYGIPLIVDEAHGSHLGFHDYFPKNSNQLGADIVIHSVHKTLPSLTQTALLHMNGNIVDRSRVKKYLKMLQSSSPSYVLMASIDACVKILEEKKEEMFQDYVSNLNNCRSQLQKLEKLKIIDYKVGEGQYDCSKIVISTKNTSISGKELSRKLLDKYHLQMEMEGIDYILAMTSIGDTKEGFERFSQALREIDQEIEYRKIADESLQISDLLSNIRREQKTSVDKMNVNNKSNDESKVENEEFYYVYPPGIPLVAPGECVSENMLKIIDTYKMNGFVIHKS